MRRDGRYDGPCARRVQQQERVHGATPGCTELGTVRAGATCRGGPVSYRVEQWCAGCGICEHVCPTQAVSILPGAQPAYAIEPLRCDDCARCVVACPVGAVLIDPDMARCRGHGCPLSSRRYMATQCTQGDRAGACPQCGGPQWRSGAAPWTCPRCTGASSGAAQARCPKSGQLRRQAVMAGLAVTGTATTPAMG